MALMVYGLKNFDFFVLSGLDERSFGGNLPVGFHFF